MKILKAIVGTTLVYVLFFGIRHIIYKDLYKMYDEKKEEEDSVKRNSF